MITMDMIGKIRRLHGRKKKSEREIAHDGAIAQHGCEVVAFSLITNVHNGAKTSHEEVLAAGEKVRGNIVRLLTDVVPLLK